MSEGLNFLHKLKAIKNLFNSYLKVKLKKNRVCYMYIPKQLNKINLIYRHMIYN